MKQELHPAAIVGLIVVVVALLVVFGSRALKPAAYEPSPGVVGAKGSAPGAVQQSTQTAAPTAGANNHAYYPAPSEGSIPGKPVNSGN